MPTVLLLPGAGGSPTFWEPVASRLPDGWAKVPFGWPGLGDEPHDPAIGSLDDLVALVAARAGSQPVDIVAQSMGCVVACRLALRQPGRVRRLVLVAMSGGVDTTALGATDWRPDYRALYPRAAPWITEARASPPLPLGEIGAPTLLLWGDADRISPVAVGRHIAARMPRAWLHVLAGGGHDLARTHADAVAGLVAGHLAHPDRSS